MVERNAADVDPLFLDAVDLPNVNSIAFTNGVTLYSLPPRLQRTARLNRCLPMSPLRSPATPREQG